MPHVGNFPIIYYPKPLPIGPSAFDPDLDTHDYERANAFLRNRAALTQQEFHAQVVLPEGVTVTKVTLFGYRIDALASMFARLVHQDRVGNEVIMSTLTVDWSDGYGSVEDTSITDPTINNGAYDYVLYLAIDPNDDVTEVMFTGALIDWN